MLGAPVSREKTMKYHSFPIPRRPLVLFVCVLLLLTAAVTLVRVRAQDGDADRSDAAKGFRNNPLIFPAGSEEAEESGETVREFGKDIYDGRDSPPDLTPYAREMITADRIPLRDAPENVSATVVDVIVNNTDTNLRNTDTFGDSETNIAINPLNPNEIVITAFSGGWGTNAPLFHSTDGGNTWTKRFTVPVPPAVGGSAGCPCDQSVDYGRGSQMSGTYLTSGTSVTDVYTGTTTNPATALPGAGLPSPALQRGRTRPRSEIPTNRGS